MILNLGTYDEAAIAAGIHPRTFDSWRARGEKDAAAGKSNDYTQFYHSITQSGAKIKAVLTGRVLEGSRRDPKFALKILERRYPEWAVRHKIEDVTPPSPKQSPLPRIMKRLLEMEERQREALLILSERDGGGE